MSKKDKEKILKAAKKAANKPKVEEKLDYVENAMSGFVERVYTSGKIVLHVGHWMLLDKLRHHIGGDSIEGLHKKRRLRDDLVKGKGKDGVIDLDDVLHEGTHVLIAQLSDNGNLQQAATYLTKKWHEKFPGARDHVLTSGKARFVDIPLLTPVGSHVLVRDPNDPSRDLGAEVTGITFDDWMGRFIFEVKFIEGLKGNAVYAQKRVRARYFDGYLPFDELSIRPLDDQTRERLTRRGETFLSLLTKDGAHYADYRGNLVLNYGWGERTVRADGRCMIDPAGFARFDQTQYSASQSQYSNRWWEAAEADSGDAGAARCTLTEDLLWMTSPMVAGYSLTTKRWGKFLIANISEINFRDDAINALVLDERKKKIIIALVKHNDDKLRFRDVIEGKGGGTIFLLHGTPGTGKTLTAEAVAEALHQPLYSVSIGELGTNPEVLEEKLTTILELAAMWRAVLLLDEADIFLEKRGNDIERNAMVGVFLRLLEYHNGVLMLTTNRVKEFDAAFHSRISLAIKYPKMSRETREAVWLRLLDAAGFGHIPAAKLSHLEINGREVKNLIRIASISAKEEGVALSVQHLLNCYALQQEFLADATGGTDAPKPRGKRPKAT